MKVVITGGAGFIGSQLGHYYHNLGHDVHLLDDFSYGQKDNLTIDGKTFGTLHECDVRNQPELENTLSDCELVIHLAGIAPLPDCQTDPQRAYSVNVGGLASVLEACRKKNVPRILFASTSAVYENTKSTQKRGYSTGYAEHDPVNPDLTYAMTKRAGENLCLSYINNYGMSIAVLRFFNVYGAHQDFLRKQPPFTGYVAKCLAKNEAPTLYNQSSAERDYIFVEDLISLVTGIAARSDQMGIYNIGTGVGFSVPKLYQIFLEVSGKDIEAKFKNPENYWDKYESLFNYTNKLSTRRIQQEVYKNSIADMSKCKKELNWEPKFNIEEGISRVYNYVLENIK
jgi:nucleoside-diphosphate-sugar epimerase